MYKKNKLSKFDIFNKILQLFYQYYFLLFNSFIIIKKVIIAKVYLIVIILKLKSNTQFNFKLYKNIQKYFLFLAQNLNLLLNLLLLKIIFIDNIL